MAPMTASVVRQKEIMPKCGRDRPMTTWLSEIVFCNEKDKCGVQY